MSSTRRSLIMSWSNSFLTNQKDTSGSTQGEVMSPDSNEREKKSHEHTKSAECKPNLLLVKIKAKGDN